MVIVLVLTGNFDRFENYLDTIFIHYNSRFHEQKLSIFNNKVHKKL